MLSLLYRPDCSIKEIAPRSNPGRFTSVFCRFQTAEAFSLVGIVKTLLSYAGRKFNSRLELGLRPATFLRRK